MSGSMFHVHGGVTRVEGQQEDVFPSSPMALVAVFTDVLRARFSGNNALGGPYVWSPDSQPTDIDPEATETPQTKLYIESQYTEEPDARDRAPGIFIDKGATQVMKVGLGHRVDIDIPSMTEVFEAWADVPIMLMCVARERGTSATIADHVFMFILASNNHIREAFGIHDISPPTLDATQVYRQSTAAPETWVTNVTIMVKIKFAWRTRPIAPILKQIAANYRFGSVNVGVVSTETRLPPR